MSRSERLRFLQAFIRNPHAVGSVTPSSQYLARALVARVPPSSSCVVELGPGTGAITRVLLDRIGPQAKVWAFETDPAFCSYLRQALPDPRLRVVQAPAEELTMHIDPSDSGVQAVVSGLPFANFKPAVRRRILQESFRALTTNGVFVGYSYGSPALWSTLRQVFGHCNTGFVLRNVPPALVFRARKVSKEA